MKSFIRLLIITFLICIPIYYIYAQTASILPPAETQFFDANGNPLSSGTVDFYIPNTFTRKTTWQDAAETIANTNPVVLDAAGKALILGSGSYRQIIKDNLGNLIWDQVTTAPLPSSGATLAGDGNAVGTIKPFIGLVAPTQYLFANGQNISRTTYATLLGVMTQVNIVTCSSGSPIITGLSDTTQIPNGAAVELSCVAAGTTVLSTTSTTVTLNANSSVNGNATATFFPFGNGNGTTTFTLPDMRGVYLAGRNNMGGVAGTKLSTTYFSSTNPNSLGATGGSQSHTMTVAELVAHNHIATSVVTDPGHTHTGIPNTGEPIGGGASSAVGGNSGVTGTSTTGITVATTTSNAGTGSAFTIIPPTMTVNYVIKVLPDISISTSNVVTSIAAQTGDFTCGTGISCVGNAISATAAGGGTVNSGTAGQLGYYAGSGTVVSGNVNTNITNGALTLGIANNVLGSVTLEGSTSGAVTLTPQTIAGTPTIIYGTSSGTPAVTASAPLAITAATGNIALTGTVPNANLANMPANTIKCNATNSPAAPQDCTQVIPPNINIAARFGSMHIWQRGAGGSASIAVTASQTIYTVDGCYLSTGANEASTVAAITGILPGSIKAAAITRNNLQTGTSEIIFGCPLDTDEIGLFAGQFITLSFYATTGANWSPTSGNITYALICGTGSPKKQITGYTNQTTPIDTTVAIAAGSTVARYQSTSAAIVPVNCTQAEIQFNWVPVGTAGVADTVNIDSVQLEIVNNATSVASSYQELDFDQQLSKAQRHFTKTFPYGTAPAQSAGVGGALIGLFGTRVSFLWQFPRQMRIAPSITSYNPSATNANCRDQTGGGDLTVSVDPNGAISGDRVNIQCSAATDGHNILIHAIADAGI